MGRPSDPAVRQRVLDRVIRHIVAAGFTEQSLDVLAKGAGVSKRVLVYHFGSREDLIMEIVTRIEAEWMDLLRRGLAEVKDPYHALGATWRELCRPRNLRKARLIFEIWGTSLHERGRRARAADALSAWTFQVGAAFPGATASHRDAVLLLAIVNGLLLARVTGVSQQDCDDAFERGLGVLSR